MPRIRLVPDRLDQETIHVHFPHVIGIGSAKTTRYPVACSMDIDTVSSVFGDHVADVLEGGETFVEVEALPVYGSE